MTGVYRGGQRYTGDDRGIQGMTGVYTGEDRGYVQGMTVAGMVYSGSEQKITWPECTEETKTQKKPTCTEATLVTRP